MSLSGSASAGPVGRPVDPDRIDLVIFDCDGVLVDSEIIAARVASECFAELGIAITPPEMIARFAGVAGPKVTQILLGENGRNVDMAERTAVTEARGRRIVAALERDLQPIPGIAATLAALGTPKCVASSSKLERILKSLELTGLSAFFGDAVFSAQQVANGKPAPDLFLLAAERMGASPGRCLVVEDSPFGVMAGRAAGMQVVGFVGGSHCGPEQGTKLATAGADQVIATMAELPPLIGRNLQLQQ